MAFSIAKLHEKAVARVKSLHGAVNAHKEAIGDIVSEAVRTGETLAGGATAAAIDYYMGNSTDAIPEGMLGGSVPIVPVAALALKGVAFAFTKNRFAADLHAYSNGLGAAATYAGLMRLFKSQAAASTG